MDVPGRHVRFRFRPAAMALLAAAVLWPAGGCSSGSGSGYGIQQGGDAPPVEQAEPAVRASDRSFLGQIWDFLTGRDLDPDE